jgi:hypothetical protein
MKDYVDGKITIHLEEDYVNYLLEKSKKTNMSLEELIQYMVSRSIDVIQYDKGRMVK